MEISVTQLWKNSGTSLKFKDWITREKEKQGIPVDAKLDLNASFNNSIQETLDEYVNASGAEEAAATYKPTGGNSVLGINRTVLIVTGLIILAGIGYKIYQQKKTA